MISPVYLTNNKVKVYSTIQKPGEFILTFPESYHAGFSVGFNVAEAVNFTAPSWLNYAEKAMKIYLASREKIPVFPIQWLAIENGRNLNKLKFDKPNKKKLVSFIEKIVKEEIEYRKRVKKEFIKNLSAKATYE